MDARDLIWTENGELVDHCLYTTDVTINDIPRIMREHRDLRRALHSAIELLESREFSPDSSRDEYMWNFIRKTKSNNPL